MYTCKLNSVDKDNTLIYVRSKVQRSRYQK